MYVPILKNRQQEMLAAKNLNYCFSDRIIPLIEIITDKYKPIYERDQITNKILYEINPDSNKRERVRLSNTEDNKVTIPEILNCLNGKRAFVDYFRYSDNYDTPPANASIVTLALELRNDFDKYEGLLLDLSRYDNLIPVVTIKKGTFYSKRELLKLIDELQKRNESIALRLPDDLWDEFKFISETILRDDDYLMFDIKDDYIDSKILQLEEIKQNNFKGHKILLNSPRPESKNNPSYEENGVTALINNAVVVEYVKYNFIGFGDFAGLKDTLSSGGGNGKGNALALLYMYDGNVFYSFMNRDYSAGTSGYTNVIKKILSSPVYAKDKDCPAYDIIKRYYDNNETGNWPQWKYITIIRYIHQMYKNI